MIKRSLSSRLCSILVALAMGLACLSACGKDAPPPAVDDSHQGASAPPKAERTGMSTGKKVVLLAGAAALYYLYKKHQNAPSSEGPDGQYYLSENGRVYYRDAEHRAHWVTPPPGGIQVPEDQAGEYREFQGYENRDTGRDLSGLSNDAE